MRNSLSCLSASLLGVLLGLAACGGGGDGGSGPVISNLSYDPKATYVNSGGGQVTVIGSFSFDNAGGGVSSVTLEVIDSVGATVSTTTTPVPSNPAYTSGTIQGQVVASTSNVGAYTIRVTLKDGAGRVSNALSGSFRIANSPWVAKTPMPHPREYFAVAKSGGLVYVIGGELLGTGTFPGPYSALVDIYDPATDTWTTGIPMSTPRIAPVAAVVNGVIYVTGGDNQSAPTPSPLEAFDPTTMQWTTKAPMPTPRSGAAAAVLNDQICVFGGSIGSDIATTECFDPVANTWTTGPSMPTARSRLGADTIGADAYAVGGHLSPPSIAEYAATVERFNIGTQSWFPVAPMSGARADLAVVTASGLLFAIGGASIVRSMDAVEVFDPTAGSWRAKTAMPLPLTRIGAVEISGAVYVFEQGNTLRYNPDDDLVQ